MRHGKMLAFRMTCKICEKSWIMMRDKNFNIGCIHCFEKQTQKKMESIWITIEPCTELDPDCFED